MLPAMELELVKNLLNEFQSVADVSGPDPTEYDSVNLWFENVMRHKRNGQLSQEGLGWLRLSFHEVLFDDSCLQGHTFLKPFGYAGDFSIINSFYENKSTSNPRLQKWDRYVQEMPAANAVRNRKDYFKNLLQDCIERKSTLSVLNLACGPCRDVLEFLDENPSAEIKFVCVDMDENAIAFARELLERHRDRVELVTANVLKYRPTQKFDLVWSAGLFDYFNDAIFVRMLGRLKSCCSPRGQMVIGNFNVGNPTQGAMEFVDWHLYYRSRSDLKQIASRCGFGADAAFVRSEPNNQNLFLHVLAK